jgi:hypothetical protein
VIASRFAVEGRFSVAVGTALRAGARATDLQALVMELVLTNILVLVILGTRKVGHNSIRRTRHSLAFARIAVAQRRGPDGRATRGGRGALSRRARSRDRRQDTPGGEAPFHTFGRDTDQRAQHRRRGFVPRQELECQCASWVQRSSDHIGVEGLWRGGQRQNVAGRDGGM